MSPAPTHTRRWFRFSLGMVFLVVTVSALSLGWELKIVRDRLWLGDEAVYYISLVYSDATWEQREHAARLFPEAFVVLERPKGLLGRPKDRQGT